jgi:DNA-binding GntR family transcriptional regulator
MVATRLALQPLEANPALRDRIYDALKQGIAQMDLYDSKDEIRLDERKLSLELGVSRTPVREALARLEQEGFVRTVPRRGVFVVRKSKREILEMITLWAALESMAARLITERASDSEIASLRRMFATFVDDRPEARIDEYSETNIRFHQALLAMSHCDLIVETAANLFIHMRSIRKRTISESDRAQRSIIDHMNIIEALERRDSALAERLAREHTLGLAAHVEMNVTYLD